ncbi:MAG: ABC transporter ATP-binding protein [Candidatus Heimdallarchaeota archaeon]|nr:MAG: ABC transporter ATP-binding protein [Candidatus Heimdallarchaeota archaeon]
MKYDRPLLQLIHYSRSHRGTLLLATLFSILNKWFDLAPPFLIAAAVDIAVRQEGSIFGYLGIGDVPSQLVFLGLLTFIIWALESLFEYIYKIYWRNLAQTIEHELRLDAYNHLQHLDMEYFEDRQTGGLMSILNDDINQLERFLDIGANDLIQVTVTAITILTAFFLLSPEVAWMAAVPMPFILVFSIKFQKRLESRYVDVRERVGILNGQLSNNLTGIATIKSYTTEEYEEGRIFRSSSDYMESNREAIKFSSAFSPLIRMIIVIGFTAMLIFGGLQTLNGQLEIAAYSAMIFLTQRLLWPLTRVGETLDQYQRAMASTTRIMTLLDTESRISNGKSKLFLSSISGGISFENVCFSYKGRNSTFTNLNVNIEPGQTIAFVGSTGVGKSTIVKLLLRFYDPQQGRITLDGVDIRDFDLQELRKAIGLVKQDTFIIDGTVRENIAYGRPDTPIDDIIKAAQVAEVHGFIESLPNGYDTLVGERGQKLSGGQRQRIAIARAVLKNPPILVLDEATSSVDNETEAAIQRSLEKIIVGRTTIIIAHRLSTIRNADRIFVLDHGEIIEQGTHNELVEDDRLYASLWKVQTGERSLA